MNGRFFEVDSVLMGSNRDNVWTEVLDCGMEAHLSRHERPSSTKCILIIVSPREFAPQFLNGTWDFCVKAKGMPDNAARHSMYGARCEYSGKTETGKFVIRYKSM